jgi:hypothetical protein
MYFLLISKHCPVKLHDSLFEAETLKPAMYRQENIPTVIGWHYLLSVNSIFSSICKFN